MMSTWRLFSMTAIVGGAIGLAPAIAQDNQSASGQGTGGAAQGQSSVDIIALPEWRYDRLYAEGRSVDRLLDGPVIGPTGDEIGDVENLLFGADGQVLSLVAEIGGFLEIGDTHVNIPWSEVEVGVGGETIQIPITEETIDDYTGLVDALVTKSEAASEIEEVEGDNLGEVETGPRVWRATELIGDYARLREGDVYANYGYVNDLIIEDDMLTAVVVAPDPAWGARGYYAYPYYGYGYGWGPGTPYYNLPYERAETSEMEPFDYEQLED